MTTVQKIATPYLFVGRTPVGGLTTGPDGAQIRNDAGMVVLQDLTGNTLTISAEDFADPTKWTPTANGYQRTQTLYTVVGRIPAGAVTSSSDRAEVINDAGDYQLQDQAGNIVVVSAEDYASLYTVVTP